MRAVCFFSAAAMTIVVAAVLLLVQLASGQYLNTNLKAGDFKQLCLYDNQTIDYLQNVANRQLDSLFTNELKSVVHRGPANNHVWNLFLEFLPNSDESSLRSNRRLFARNAVDQQAQTGKNMAHTRALQTSENARKIDALATVGLAVSKNLANKLASKNLAKVNNDNVQLLATVKAPSEFCPFKQNIFCDPNSKFSKIDGTCNNLQQPWLGKAETPYKRYFGTTYDDGIGEARKRAKSGRPLPNPRVISRALMTDNAQSETFYSHVVALFGQFLTHDITSASVSSDSSGSVIDCPCDSVNPACMSVTMPSGENVMRMSCMKFTRSSAAFPNFECNLGHREQLNLLTSFIDLTTVYGPSEDRARQLRALQRGQLKASQGVTQRPYLVQAVDKSCRDTDSTRQCFAAGEGRTNENMGLTSIQTLFFREHNRIANELSSVNPQWDDERLFQEARRINIAIFQHIIYNEWLPTVIGLNNAALFDLTPLPTVSYFQGYDPNVNPQLSNEFASAAFRFGHTLVRNQYGRFNANGQPMSTPVVLSDLIFRPVEAYNAPAGGLESIFVGLFNEPARKFDSHLADTLQNHLFEFRLSDGSVIAIDLAATNINRGRDHGIPTYNDIRERCGFARARNFNDLANLMPINVANELGTIYEDVDDIDLYVGGLSENSAAGGLVGPTFACVIANQFKDLKKGDRFYYENGPSNIAFTLPQLAEIKKATLSRLACNNFDINLIQPNGFLQPLQQIGNTQTSCNSLQFYDLSKWKE